MNDKAIYQGFEPQKQAEYEDWLAEHHGKGVRKSIEESKRRMIGRSAELKRSQAEYQSVEDGLADALLRGSPADSAPVQALVKRHHAWVGDMWGRTPSRDA